MAVKSALCTVPAHLPDGRRAPAEGWPGNEEAKRSKTKEARSKILDASRKKVASACASGKDWRDFLAGVAFGEELMIYRKALIDLFPEKKP